MTYTELNAAQFNAGIHGHSPDAIYFVTPMDDNVLQVSDEVNGWSFRFAPAAGPKGDRPGTVEWVAYIDPEDYGFDGGTPEWEQACTVAPEMFPGWEHTVYLPSDLVTDGYAAVADFIALGANVRLELPFITMMGSMFRRLVG